MLKSIVRFDSEMPGMSTKCGEIHFQKRQWYFICVYCGMDIKTHEGFRSHFESQHLDCLEIFVGSLENPCFEEKTLMSIKPYSLSSKADDDPLQDESRFSVKDDFENSIIVDKHDTAQILDCIRTEDGGYAYNTRTEISENTTNGSTGICTDERETIEAEIIENDDCIKKRAHMPRNKTFSCTYCERTFRRRYQFDTHLNIHTGAKPHQCEICGRQFRAITTLQRHISTHKQRHFVCKHCDKSFSHKVALLSHETRHTQERREPCDLCEKRFYTVNQLDTHKRRVHKESNEILPFACDLCTNRYRTASMLSTHKCRKHYRTAKFQCEKCDKKFIDIQRLQDHQSIHVNGKISSQFNDGSEKVENKA